MKELDHLQVELSGTNLIEASAGTGKTYAIACLYLRLLIEQELAPDRILVVTFTEAATEELRGRIRSRIREALEAFAGEPEEDPFLRGLVANANGRGPDRAAAMDLLDRALKSFDTASIFTIHGFCLRALQDNAFESGSLYDTELVGDPSALLREVVDDFWRRNFFGDRAPLLQAALRKGYSPDSFMTFVGKMVDNPKMKVLPDLGSSDPARLDRQCLESFAEVKIKWKNSRKQVLDILNGDKGLSRKAGVYRNDILPQLFGAMDTFTEGDNPCDLFPGFDKFCTSGIVKGTKPTGTAPSHPFFDTCETLKKNVEERLLLLKWELIEFCRERLPVRKREANIRFFSDLLNDLFAALHGSSGEVLAGRLREKYRAALIDEFQDTDPVQYDIFRSIYSGPDTPLFLIGDPKQAIYSFRGADIFAYLEAARQVEEAKRFTLTSNWRSAPRLLDAFNTVFDNERKPFLFAEIAYHPVKSGKADAGCDLSLDGADGAPLQIWTFPAGENGEPLSVGKAGETVQACTAAEIARLLRDGEEGRALIKGRPLVPADIAVIVRTHRQAGLIQEALRERGIPSVMRSDETIFATGEARDIRTLLAAVADPASEHKVKAALATDIIGLSGNDIAGLLDDEKSWEGWLEKFRDYRRAWLERGFMVMSQNLLDREGVRGRLLGRADGERRLTNVLHCFEVIHQASAGGRHGMESLLAWFGEKIAGGENSEECQIRLETDEKAVKIVTVHVSKGLEYPIVFCPYLWGGTRTDNDVVTFHDNFTMIRDFGSDEAGDHRVLAERENLAEGLRLLYVALTRAKYRCCLAAGKVGDKTGKNRPETSPLSYLFHAPEKIRALDDLVDRMAAEVKKIDAAEMEEQLREIAGKGEGAVTVVDMPQAGTERFAPSEKKSKVFAARSFTSPIDRDWRVASFTSFTKREERVAELPDRDQTGGEAQPAEPAAAGKGGRGTDMFAFPRGTQAGIFLHELFEKIDFTDAGRDKVGELAAKCLEKHGYPGEWLPAVCNLVADVLSVPLPAPEGTFTLSGLQKGRWVTELEFFFPLRFITSDLLQKCLCKWNGRSDAGDLSAICASLGFRPVRGMVRGFMDLVFEHDGRFYLVDWKSNHLGNSPGDYAPKKLGRAMEKHQYPLQYLLYTVALNRYLSQRVKGYDYESGFGGVLYLFLRGISPENGGNHGIFHDVPPAGLIRELTGLLIEAVAEGDEDDR